MNPTSRTLVHIFNHPRLSLLVYSRKYVNYISLHTGLTNTLQRLELHRNYSTRKPFITKIIDNFKEEWSKNKEIKESLKKFREEREALEQTAALKAAREKFKAVEKEATKGKESVHEAFSSLKDKVSDALEEASKTTIAQKAGKISENVSSTVSETTSKIGQSEAFKTISAATKAINKEISSQGIEGRVYQPPGKLRKRKDISAFQEQRHFEPNIEATGLELHKDSKFYQSWQNFKENNKYINNILDLKLKYDESENPVIRASRALTNKVSDIFGGLFQNTELSSTLTEICKVDPNFNTMHFIRDCENDIIPNILEAMVRGDLDILRDWCHESPYRIFEPAIKQAKDLGYKIDSKVLDIDNVDLVMGKVMDQGPVLMITFTSQQIMCVRDAKGDVVEGDPEKIMRVNYVWVLCRDMEEPNSKAAWRLLELHANSVEKLV